MLDKTDDVQQIGVRVWCDGCYDLVHFGHANSLRQAKAFGDHLVVGVHSDEDICRHKGPPVFTFDERCRLVEAIKWVDEVVRGAPYVTTLEVLDEHGCGFCCHGDDVTMTDDGTDTYHRIKAAGRYKEVQRTRGVSTTALVDRVLDMAGRRKGSGTSPWTGSGNKLLLSTEKIVSFSEGRAPKPGDVVVYVAGDFDLFHVGHLQLLEKAKALGDYLIVGLYSDQVVHQCKGDYYPIMTLHERLLTLLAYKYVNEVVIEAPFVVSRDLMDNFKIDLVVVGDHCRSDLALCDPYEYPKKVDRLVVIDCSSNNVTRDTIIERIVKNKFVYLARNERKERKELELIDEMEKRTKCEPSTN